MPSNQTLCLQSEFQVSKDLQCELGCSHLQLVRLLVEENGSVCGMSSFADLVVQARFGFYCETPSEIDLVVVD